MKTHKNWSIHPCPVQRLWRREAIEINPWSRCGWDSFRESWKMWGYVDVSKLLIFHLFNRIHIPFTGCWVPLLFLFHRWDMLVFLGEYHSTDFADLSNSSEIHWPLHFERYSPPQKSNQLWFCNHCNGSVASISHPSNLEQQEVAFFAFQNWNLCTSPCFEYIDF